MRAPALPLPARRATLDSLASYRRLLRRRRDRSREALAAHLADWQDAQQRCEARSAERAALQSDVDALHDWRRRGTTTFTAADLQSAARRAHWLAYDIEKADYYLEMARDELIEAERERERLLRDYRLAEERLRAIESNGQRLERRLAARAEEIDGEYR